MSSRMNTPLEKLRDMAEQLINQSPKSDRNTTTKEVEELLHELQVHQAELEIQNEELRDTQHELEISRNCYTYLFHNAPVGYLTLNRSGMIYHANQTFANMLGVDLTDVYMKPFNDYLDRQDGKVFLARFRAFFESPEHKTFIARLDPPRGSKKVIVSITGRVSEFPIQKQGVKESPLLLITLTDITEQKQIEAELKQALNDSQQRENEISALLDSAKSALECQTFEQAARGIFDACCKAIGAKSGYVALLSEDGKENEVLFLEDGGLPCTVDPELPMPIRGLRAEAYQLNQVVYDNDFMRSEWAKFMPEGHVDLENVMFAPLILEGKTVGIMGLANKSGGFDERDANLAAAFGSQAAISLRSARDLDALRNSEQRFRELFDHMGSGVIIYEAVDDGRDFVIKDINPAGLRIGELKREEQIGRRITDVYPGAMKIGLQKVLQRVWKTEQAERLPIQEYKDERISLWVDNYITKTPGGQLIVVFNDVTQQILAERKIHESETKIKHIIDHSTNLFYSHNTDHEITYLSPQVKQILGYEPEEAKIKWTELLTDNPINVNGIEITNQAIRTGETQKPYELELRHKSGKSVWVEVREAPVLEEGKTVGIVGALTEITAQKYEREERQKLEAKMQHAQKLESLGVLAGGIAHDFNNLLMAILGNADLALHNLSSVSPAHENIQEIITASRRAAELCNQMLAYSGKGQFLVKELNISEVVKEMSHILEVSISKKAVLRYNFGDLVPRIEADATQIRQIIMNLITNASEAIGDRSGVICITTGAMECSRNYLDQYEDFYFGENLSEGIYTYIEVADTGCGMTEKVKKKIFDPFFTTKFTGRGLGMAAVLGIVRGHKGAVRVYSEEGQGTTIKILFPIIDHTKDPYIENEEKLTTWRGHGTILLVDDEETVRAVARKMLEALNFNVITASDGREAVERYKEKHDTIAAVILDYTMPHMDGETCFRELRQMDKDVKVIISSGYTSQEIKERFAGKGLLGCIQKPYQINDLRQKLEFLNPNKGS